ncbi:MAG TPA: hypothetical protein VMW27_10910, partial [Thermoanaerobaculia bacterium]|nr:hypothetical protein [Thermoanaerobaculia bacterium]
MPREPAPVAPGTELPPSDAPIRIEPQQMPPIASEAVLTSGPADVARILGQLPKLEPGSPLFVAWEVPLAAGVDPAPMAATVAADARAVQQAGGTPWLVLVFRAPAPLARAARLQEELQAAAALAAQAPANTWFQVVWLPEPAADPQSWVAEYSFLIKRAAVALTGARPEANVATQALPADPARLEALYAEDVAAYLEAVALEPAEPARLTAAIAALDRLDPGRPVVLDSLEQPADAAGVLAESARATVQGIDLTLFRTHGIDLAGLAPFSVLAREFAGDLSYDPTSVPTGAAEAWTFVRGKDLALRVIAQAPEGAGALT